MPYLFKKKIYKKVYEVACSLAVLGVLVGSLFNPQLVNTETNKVVANALNPFTQTLEDVTGRESAVEFPEIKEVSPLRILKVMATAYSSDPWQTDSTPCKPAMDFDLCENYLKYGIEDTIAANFLPLGAKVRFPELYGDKVFTVRDRMNVKYNFNQIGYYRIDFYKAAATEEGKLDIKTAKYKAINFGIKQGLKMEVLAYAK